MKNTIIYVLILFACVGLVGCSNAKQCGDTSESTVAIEDADSQELTNNASAPIAIVKDDKIDDVVDTREELILDVEEFEETDKMTYEGNSSDNMSESDFSSKEDSDKLETESKIEETIGHDTIVWIGDSLTQGSLGHDNDNLANAPYVKLANLSGRNIEGFGFYGNTAHDIFWLFRDETQKNQSIDPSKAYIFWVGANDWVNNGVVSTDAGPIIAEIDNFISHGVTDYIVIGTIARVELRDESAGAPAYKIIDEQLMNHYGSHYLDVIDVITLGGYGPDDIHLTQEAYDNVAKAVYNKLKSLNYIN